MNMLPPVRCRHCGAILLAETPGEPIPAGLFGNLSPMPAAILRILVKDFGEPVLTERLISALYGADGGPLDAYNSVRVRISILRHAVRPFGLVIVNERFPSSYRLDRALR